MLRLCGVFCLANAARLGRDSPPCCNPSCIHFYNFISIRADRCHVECSRRSAPGRRQWWWHQARCAAIADWLEARVAVFPLPLCFGDAGAVAGDEVPPHLERRRERFAVEQQDFAAGGQLELQAVAAGFEVEEFVAAQGFAGGGDLAKKGEQAVFEFGLQRQDERRVSGGGDDQAKQQGVDAGGRVVVLVMAGEQRELGAVGGPGWQVGVVGEVGRAVALFGRQGDPQVVAKGESAIAGGADLAFNGHHAGAPGIALSCP